MGIFSKVNNDAKKMDEKPAEAKADSTEKKDASQENEIAINDKDLQATGFAYQVLIRPIISEKAAILADEGQYTFEVAWNANRSMVRDAIKRVYGKTPRKVNIITMKGKAKRFRRLTGKRNDWKKAVVILPKGEKLEVYEGV